MIQHESAYDYTTVILYNNTIKTKVGLFEIHLYELFCQLINYIYYLIKIL